MTLASTLAAASATKPAPCALTSEASCSDSSAPSTLVQAAQLITAPGRSRVISRSTLAGSVTSRSSWVSAITWWRMSSATRTTSWPSIPFGSGDQDLHGIEMSALSPTRKRSVFGIPSLRLRLTFLPSRLASIRACEVADAGAGQDDRVLDLGAGDHDVAVDRRVGADVGVGDLGAGADDGRARGRRCARASPPSRSRPGPRPGSRRPARRRSAARCPRARAGSPRACPRASRCPSTSP